MGQPVVHFEVVGNDGDALRRFYGELFGWKVDKVPGDMDYGMVSGDDAGIAGGIGAGPDGAAHVTFYVQVPDLKQTLDSVESAGGKTRMPPAEVGEGTTIAQFEDPQGNVVGLVQG